MDTRLDATSRGESETAVLVGVLAVVMFSLAASWRLRTRGAIMNFRRNGPIGLAAGLLMIIVGLLALASSVHAQTVTTLYSFTGSNGAGAFPNGLMQGRDGNFYGTTVIGGGPSTCPRGCGTVFQLNAKTGVVTTLYSFTGSNGDGAFPNGLIQGREGNFYGTTGGGGGPFYCAPVQEIPGCGTLFQVNAKTGAVTILYAFTGSDGYPSRLIQGRDGDFYGTTIWGAAAFRGSVFRMDAATHAVTILYGFTGGYGEGSYPSGSLLQGRDGNFYGVTRVGGDLHCPIPDEGCGIVFRMDPTTYAVTTLHSFAGSGGEGAQPSSLLQGRDGNFYGTTAYGGGVNCSNPFNESYGCGTVFRMDATTYAVTTLHSFAGSGGEGAYPTGLIQGRDGNFYGMTQFGGASPLGGTLFQLNPKTGVVTMLYSFMENSSYPNDLIQGRDGNFYGTTWGTVFILQSELGHGDNDQGDGGELADLGQ